MILLNNLKELYFIFTLADFDDRKFSRSIRTHAGEVVPRVWNTDVWAASFIGGTRVRSDHCIKFIKYIFSQIIFKINVDNTT